MKTTRKLLTVTAFLSAAWVWAPAPVQAAPGGRKSVLEGEPIVRKKLQLRKFRFQLTPYIGMSLSQPFVHMGYVGARAGFHFADWIGARAGFGYGVVNVDSALLRAINGGGLPVGIPPGERDNSVSEGPPCAAGGAPCRPLAEQLNPAPLLHDFQAGLTRAQWQASVDAVFTPFAGKLGLFSAAFTNYDIYLFGGLGLVGWKKHTDETSTAERLGLDTNPESPNYCTSASGQNPECLLHPVDPDDGVKLGVSFGGGVHLFINNFVAMNLEVQDIVTSNNLAGLNTTVEDIPPLVNRDDRDVFHNVTLQIGAKIYIPFKAKRTN